MSFLSRLRRWNKVFTPALPKDFFRKLSFERLESRLTPASTIFIVSSGGAASIPAGAMDFADTGFYSINASVLDSAPTSIILRATNRIGFLSGDVNILGANAHLDAQSLGDITFNGGVDLLSSGGANISLLANQGPTPTPGSFTGIFVQGIIQTSGGGNILLQGRGGDGANNRGIIVNSLGQVRSTGTGSVTLNGTGGSGTSGNDGVFIAGGTVSSQAGAVQIIGSATSGTSINVSGNAVISGINNATLTLNGAQSVSISGGSTVSTVNGNLTILANQGTPSAAGNFAAININGASATVTTTGTGNLLLVGTGPDDAATARHIGVLIQGAARVQATGTGSIAINGTGGRGTDSNFGVQVTGSNTMVQSAAGAISITGQGGAGLAASSSDVGVLLADEAHVTGTGAGPIAITGTGGTGTSGELGVSITGAFTEVMTGTGAISITGTGGSGSGSTAVNLLSSAQVIGSSTITLTGDSMSLDGNASINSSGSVVTLQPLTAGTPINLGSKSSGVLGLTTAELNVVTTGALHIGNDTAGAIIVSAAVAPVGTPTLSLFTGSTITETGSGKLTIANLGLGSVGLVSLSAANAIGTLAAQVSGAGTFLFTDNNPLVVGTVESLAGIFTAGGNVALTVNGLLTLGESIAAPGAIVDLNAAGVTENGGSIISADGLRLRGTGTFVLANAGNTFGTIAAAVTGPITLQDDADLTVGTVGGTTGIRSQGGSVVINTTAGNTITVAQSINTQPGTGGVVVTNPATVFVNASATLTAGTGNILLNAAGLAYQVTVFSGGGQSATVNTAFAAPIVVTVTDVFGNAVSGAAVAYAGPGAGASAGFSAAPVTNAAGQTQTNAMANTVAGGPYTVNVTSGAAATTFQLINTPRTRYQYRRNFPAAPLQASSVGPNADASLSDADLADTAATAGLGAAQLQSTVTAALDLLALAGLDSGTLAVLGATQFQVGDLPSGYLGLAYTSANRVVIDSTAAGHGWFVDATPYRNEEFDGGSALPGGPAAGRMDLLSAVLHELGHVAGLDHGDGVMAESLARSTRTMDALDAFFAR